MTILAGDVGGTKTNLALFHREGKVLHRARLHSFPSGSYPDLESILAEFLPGKPGISVACIGVAGPVVSGRSRVTNLPWVVDGESIQTAIGAKRAFIINDLQATAFAVPVLPDRSLAVLQRGEADLRGNIAVIAAGTGLGASFLVWTGTGYLPVASEGGHADFAPRDEQEVRLFRYLQGRYGRVSVERAVSGPGLHDIYRFLPGMSRHAWLQGTLRASSRRRDSPDLQAPAARLSGSSLPFTGRRRETWPSRLWRRGG
jgi:glucokinase